MNAELQFDKPQMQPNVKLYHGDCLTVMPTLPSTSVHMVFADLPYGCTGNKWDVHIPIANFWNAVFACVKKNTAYVLSATQPFASSLITSNAKNFRYDIVYAKTTPTGFLNAKKMPLRGHESLLVFYAALPTYNPQMTVAQRNAGKSARTSQTGTDTYGVFDKRRKPWVDNGTRFPTSILTVTSENRVFSQHPTQKPVALLEWLIKTYTNLGDTVLDPVFGSCTTGVACLRTGRNFIGIEKDATYFEVGRKRIAEEQVRLKFDVTV